MKALLLSRQAKNYSSRRLVEAFAALGHELVPVDPLRCAMSVGRTGLELEYRGAPLEGDGVLPRFGPGLTEYGLELLRHLESIGIPSLNVSDAVDRSRDKFRTLQILAAAGLPVPETCLARDEVDLERALERVGRGPVVVKVLKGSQGTGVLLLRDRDQAMRFARIAWAERQNVLLQEFVATPDGSDLRVVVLGGEVVAAMSRVPASGDFRSNLHRGSRARPVDPNPAVSDLAVQAARVVGLDLAGVDLLASDVGPRLLELNPSPGLEGIERTTGLDVAARIAARCAERFGVRADRSR